MPKSGGGSGAPALRVALDKRRIMFYNKASLKI